MWFYFALCPVEGTLKGRIRGVNEGHDYTLISGVSCGQYSGELFGLEKV